MISLLAAPTLHPVQINR